MTKSQNATRSEPRFLVRLRKAPPVAFAVMICGAVVGLGAVVEAVGKMWDRMTTSEGFVLAEQSAKSVFSDQLAQRAWRRLFWADNFRARVINQASVSDIDDSWAHYIESDADWNANIMISIVGLQQHYDAARSDMLESWILPAFSDLDRYLGALRRSHLIKDLRSSRDVATHSAVDFKDLDDANEVAACAESATSLLKYRLYILVRCFSDKDKTRANLCESYKLLNDGAAAAFTKRCDDLIAPLSAKAPRGDLTNPSGATPRADSANSTKMAAPAASPANALQDASADKCQITIDSPTEQTVGSVTHITGGISRQAGTRIEDKVWVVIHPEGGSYWVGRQPVVSGGRWEVIAELGPPETASGHSFEVKALFAPTEPLRAGDQLLEFPAATCSSNVINVTSR